MVASVPLGSFEQVLKMSLISSLFDSFFAEESKDVPKGGGADGVHAPPWRLWGPRKPQARRGPTTAFVPRAAGSRGDGLREPNSSEA